MDKTLLSIQDASKFLKVSTKTLRRWEASGLLLPLRTNGGHRRYILSELKWVKRHGVKANPKPKPTTVIPTIAPVIQAQPVYAPPVVVTPAPVIPPTPIVVEQPRPTRPNRLFKAIPTLAIVVITILGISAINQFLKPNLPQIINLPVEVYQKVKVGLGNFFPKNQSTEIANLKEKAVGTVLAEQTTFESLRLKTNVPSTFEEDITINADLLSDLETLNVFNQTVTTLAIGGEATDITIGATTGTTQISNNLDVNGTNNDIAGTLNLSGNILAASADLTIDATGGGVKIGTGTPGTVDLAGDDLYVTGDLEVDGIAYIPTLSINSDNFTDLTGTGLQISSGALQATLGTSIATGEIDDSAITTAKINSDAVTSAKIANDSILEVDLSVTNDPTEDYMLTYDASSGGFTWVDPSSAVTGPWTDNGTNVSLTTSTDSVTIGSSTELAKLGIDGDTDEIQFLVQGVSGQTASHIVVENSSGTDLFTVASNGNVDTAGDYTMNSADPAVFFNDDTGASDDYYISVDASIMTLTNSTDARNEILFNGSGSIDIGDNTATKTIDIGGNDSSATDTINIGINSTANDFITIGNNHATTTVDITSGPTWSVTGTGLLTLTPNTNSDALSITGTSITSNNLISLDSRNTSGTLINVAYGSSTTLVGALVGQAIDFNSGNVTATNEDVTGLNIKLPTVTDTETSGTNTLTGLLVNFGAGAGIAQTGNGGTLEYIAGDFRMPALTQTDGALNAYGVQVVTPSSITTGGTAYGLNVSATGVGAGTLAGLNVGTITGGSGTEYAINVASGWDAVLRVGSTTVINGSGITQVPGGGTGAATFTTNGVLYGNSTSALGVTAAGTSGQVLVGNTGSAPSWGTISGSSCSNCLVSDPTGDQVIAPTGQGTTGLIVRQTSTASPTDDIFQITNSAGDTKYFYVDVDGNVSTGAISNTTLTLTPTTNTTALTLVGTNVTSAKNQYINTSNDSGTIFDLSYGAASTLDGTLVGANIDLSTNNTATDQSVSGAVITLPQATNTITSGTRSYNGITITAGGGYNQSGSGGTLNFNGANITIPAITQGSGGTLTANGVTVTTPSSITTGGTANAFNVTATGISVGTLTGVNIGAIGSPGAGTEYALQIGSGWDRNLYFNDTSTSILAADGATITITDGTNTLCTITDSGTTGDLACTGNVTGGSAGTSGFWARSGTNLSPATAGDDVLLPDSDTIQFGTGTDSSIAYDGTNLVIDPDLVGTGTVRIAGTEGADKLTITAGDVNVSDGSLSITDDDAAASLSVTNDVASTLGAAAATGVTDLASISLTTGTLLNLELTEGTLNGGHYLKAWDVTAGATVFSIAEDGNTTIAGAGGSTVFTITAGDAVLSDGSIAITDADNAASLSLTNNAADTVGVSAATGLIDLASTSLTTGTLLNLELTEGTLNGGHYLKAWDATGGSTVFSIAEDGNTTIAGTAEGTAALTLTAGDAVVTDGDLTVSGGETSLTSNSNTVNTLSVTNNTITTLGNGANTAGMVDFSSTTLSSGNLLNLETTTSLTSGRVLNIGSTATGLTTGSLVYSSLTGNSAFTGNLNYFDWNPTAATTASGNLFTINIDSDGTTTGDLFQVQDSGTDLFRINESIISSALPHEFTAAGDVSIAYDIQFTNQTASTIKSNAALTIQPGESFESNNLVLAVYNAASVVVDGSSDVNTSTAGVLDINVNSITANNVGLNIDYTMNDGATGAADQFGAKLNLTVNDADGDQFGFQIQAQSSANLGAGDIECLLCLDTADTTAGAVARGIWLQSSGVTAGITDDIVFQNAETINNATDGTVLIEDGGATTLISAGTTDFKINLDDTATFTETVCHSGADGATGVVDIGDCNVSGGGADLAELFGSGGDLEAGDIVMMDEAKPAIEYEHEDFGHVSKAYVTKTTTSYQNTAIGVISTNPAGVVLSEGVFQEEEHPVPVALVGRVPVKVSTENGPIYIGDFITPSSIPGVGMKATNNSRVIGRALSVYTSDNPTVIGKVIIFVEPTWYAPSQFALSPESSESATLTDRVTSLENMMVLLQTQENLGNNNASGSANLTDMTLNKLTVLEDAVLPDTVINGKLNVGSLVFDNINNSIDAIGVLKIQSLALDNIEFLGGLITFDKNGNIKAQEIEVTKVAVKGSSAGSATLLANETEIFVDTDQVKSGSLIFVTPKITLAYPLAVVEKQEGIGFKVKVSQSESQDVEFDWWIVDHTAQD